MDAASKGRSVYFLSTSQAIEKYCNSDSRDVFLRDPHLRGFGLRVTPGNTKSFFVETRQGSTGKVRRLVLGHYPILSLKQARKRALEALGELKYGETTGGTKEPCLRALVDRFLEAKAQVLRPSSVEDYRMVFYSLRRSEGQPKTQGCFGDWMDRPVRSITGALVMERYRDLCEERGIGMANKAMRVLNGALNYGKAIYPPLLEWTNPVSVLTATRCRRTLRPRTRYIPLEKVGCWVAAVEAERDPQVVLLFKLMLMTGLRSKEARSLKWSQVDLERGTITIGSEQAKNHQEVSLPINSWLKDELTAGRDLSKTYVFENPAVKEGYIRNLKRPLQRITARSGLDFTPHDLRRSFATYLDTVGAPFGVIKQLLNHKTTSDVTERYIQRRNMTELRKYSEAVWHLVCSSSIDLNRNNNLPLSQQVSGGTLGWEQCPGTASRIGRRYLER
jgi:integrase